MESIDAHGVSVNTLVPSPVIKDLVVCRSATGQPVVVVVRERSLTINGVFTPLLFDIRAARAANVSENEDLLVLSTSTGYILMLKVYADGSCPRVIAQERTSMGVDEGCNGYGYDIQVDFEGRVLAATSIENDICLYTLKQSTEFNGNLEIEFSQRFDLTLEDCVILFTCFLHPLKDAHDYVLYLVIYASPGAKLKLTLYEWNSQNALSTASPVCTLPLNIENPLFVIPAVIPNGAAVIASEKRLYLISMRDMMNGEVRLKTAKLPAPPLGFFKDPCTERRSLEEDTFYLLCEDCIIYSVVVGHDKLSMDVFVDMEGNYIGNCFTIQPFDGTAIMANMIIKYMDRVLITFGGDSADGGHMEAYKVDEEWRTAVHPKAVGEPILAVSENWAPIVDFEVVDTKHGSTELVACAGIGDSGSLVTLTHGVKAKVFTEVDTKFKGAVQIRFIADESRSFIFICYPTSTEVLRIESYEDGGLGIDLCADPRWADICDVLAVKFMPHTDNAVIVFSSGILFTDMYDHTGFWKVLSIEEITAASISRNMVAIARNTTGGPLVELLEVEAYAAEQDEHWIDSVGLTQIDGVTFVELVDRDIEMTCWVGTTQQKIHHFDVGELKNKDEPGFGLDSSMSSVIASFDADAVPTCIVQDLFRVIIGTRNGAIVVFDEEYDFMGIVSVGIMPVRTLMKAGDDGHLLALGDSLHMLYFGNDETTVMNQPTAVTAPEEQFQNFSALCSFKIAYPAPFEASLVPAACVLNDRLKILQLDLNPRVFVARRTILGNTPKRLVYLAPLSTFAVALDPPIDGSGPGHLAFVHRGTFSIVSPDMSPRYFKKDGSKGKQVLYNDESVTSMCEWNVTIAGKQYLYLVLGTMRAHNQGGRLLAMRLSKDPVFKTIKLREHFSFVSSEGPVMAVCAYGDDSIVLSTFINDEPAIGKLDLVYDDVTRKCRLSPLVYSNPCASIPYKISVNGSIITCTTQSSSVMVFTVKHGKIRQIQGAIRNRSMSCHLTVPLSEDEDIDLVLAADKSRSIIGYRRQGSEGADRPLDSDEDSPASAELKVLWRAIIPCVVLRIRRVDFSKLWRLSAVPKVGYLACGIDGSFYCINILSHTDYNEYETAQSSIMQVDTDDSLVSPGVTWSDSAPNEYPVVNGDLLMGTRSGAATAPGGAAHWTLKL